MAMQVGFGGAFTHAFAVTGHHHHQSARSSLPLWRYALLWQFNPCLVGHAVKSDEMSHYPVSKIWEIAIHNLELQILGEPVENSDKYR
jgi:hypothetical protein